jgi:type I restriction enzyme S subunit
MSEWREYKLGDIGTFSYGKMPKKDLLNTGDFPTFSGYKYQYTYPESNCNKNDLIVVARGVGGTGDVKIVREDCYFRFCHPARTAPRQWLFVRGGVGGEYTHYLNQ